MLLAAAILCTSGLLAQKPGVAPIDPLLPESLRPTIEKAVEAELDPKRGVGNAIEILKAKRSEVAGQKGLELSLDLRTAALQLRDRFMTANEFKEEVRPVQALATFSRLDLLEPGLSPWIDRALDKNPDAKKKLGRRGTWTIKTALLIRGSGLDKKLVHDVIASTLAKVGAKLEIAAAKDAPMVITIGAEDAPHQPTEAAVKVTIGLQSIDKGKIVWEQSLFRIEAAKSFDVALKSALDWAARIGGRDLFFRWLGETAFPLLIDPMPHGFSPPKPQKR